MQSSECRDLMITNPKILFLIILLFADSGLVIVLVIILSLFSILASVLTIIDHEACPVLFQNNSVASFMIVPFIVKSKPLSLQTPNPNQVPQR